MFCFFFGSIDTTASDKVPYVHALLRLTTPVKPLKCLLYSCPFHIDSWYPLSQLCRCCCALTRVRFAFPGAVSPLGNRTFLVIHAHDVNYHHTNMEGFGVFFLHCWAARKQNTFHWGSKLLNTSCHVLIRFVSTNCINRGWILGHHPANTRGLK